MVRSVWFWFALVCAVLLMVPVGFEKPQAGKIAMGASATPRPVILTFPTSSRRRTEVSWETPVLPQSDTPVASFDTTDLPAIETGEPARTQQTSHTISVLATLVPLDPADLAPPAALPVAPPTDLGLGLLGPGRKAAQLTVNARLSLSAVCAGHGVRAILVSKTVPDCGG